MTGRARQRIVSIWWPSLAIERLLKTSPGDFPPDAALALVEQGAHGPRIVAASSAARAGGARIRGRLSDARALNPTLAALPADSAGDQALVARLARWALRWSPLVEVEGSDGLRLDITGAAHLFGSEAGLAEDMRSRFAALGLTVRLAIAPTAGAAWALARHGRDQTSRCGADDLHRLLGPLPVAALRLSPEAARMLERLGLKTIGELARVPRRALARRFAGADDPLSALDRALGTRPEPLSASPAEPPPRADLRLAEPVADSKLMGDALERLAPPLAAELGRRLLGARRIEFFAWRVDGSVGEAAAATTLPSRDPAHFIRLLGERVAALDPGFGCDGFALVATRCEPLAAQQQALIGEPRDDVELALLVDRLSARLGPERVRRPVSRQSHLPERASDWQSALAAGTSKPAGGGPFSDTAPRPERLLDRPESIAVVYATPEGIPRRFVWRRAVHDIAKVEGPERIAPEWWRQPGGTRLRDYYRVEDKSGRRYWIYREGIAGDGRGGAPAWFLHGLFG